MALVFDSNVEGFSTVSTFYGIFSSVKVMQAPAVIFSTSWSIPSTEIMGVTYASLKAFKRALR